MWGVLCMGSCVCVVVGGCVCGCPGFRIRNLSLTRANPTPDRSSLTDVAQREN